MKRIGRRREETAGRRGRTRRLRDTARALQARIEDFYALEAGPDVGGFVREADDGARESLMLRENPEDVELLLMLPRLSDPASLDEQMQVVEGVSHFVYLAERLRVGLPATQLELELQAEVDKFVILAFDGARLANHRVHRIQQTLYRSAQYVHVAESEQGRRYRLANDLAERISQRLFDLQSAARRWLMRFYRSGQTEKIRLARAA